ncbi:N-acetylmuramoyl-L-alanine amidase [Methylococcus sp. EFPC2]|uniref:N-acetylmuramoyl-L-alanine amidase n=1 Tax=Methylococcus sp. EFPC2 TaxID=2812648 RepID=UPI001F074E4D|nr:N-acetylmuramoyl-L-alanine amidase [Methylococcus sp. EFPC2]
MNLATNDKNTRLLFDFSAPVAASLERSGDKRVSLVLPDTEVALTLKPFPDGHPLVGHIGWTKIKEGVRVDVDLKAHAGISQFKEKRGARWVLELTPAGSAKVKADKAERPASGKTLKVAPAPREYVVAIDAGHGGKDTGAIGPSGIMEKDVVMSVARTLAGMIQAEPGMRALMVRKDDAFIDLRQRAETARKAHADLFVSLHADAYINGDAHGSSVFTLSRHGATSVAARWLADRENSSDLVGGVKLRDKDKVLASVLLDLSQNATIEASDRAAQRILRELEKNHTLHHSQVQKAGFVVLKSPDIPSLLVETAFISNPEEERRLSTQHHQTLIARSIFNGIRAYFANKAPKLPTVVPTRQADSKAVVLAKE